MKRPADPNNQKRPKAASETTAADMPARRRAAVVSYLLIVAIGVAADLWSKRHVFGALPAGEDYRLIPRLITLRISLNEGAAFGLGKGMAWLFVAVSVAACAGMAWAVWRYGAGSRLLTIGLGLITSGAIGNLWDRIMHGGVVRDFILLHIGGWTYPAIFNVADVAICVGCAMVLWHSFIGPSAGGARRGAEERS